MMNYTEIPSRSTIVPEVLVPCIPENEAVSLALSPAPVASCQPLAALLACPEFQQGLAFAQEEFFSDYEAAPLSEEGMLEEVEMNLSRHVTERSKAFCRLFGDEPPSYLQNLGYVLGIINQGLTYAR